MFIFSHRTAYRFLLKLIDSRDQAVNYILETFNMLDVKLWRRHNMHEAWYFCNCKYDVSVSVERIALFEIYVFVYCLYVKTLLIRVANLCRTKSVTDVDFVQ